MTGVKFNMVGWEINEQYLNEGSLRHKLNNGWHFDITIFGEFGDIKGCGTRLKAANMF